MQTIEENKVYCDLLEYSQIQFIRTELTSERKEISWDRDGDKKLELLIQIAI